MLSCMRKPCSRMQHLAHFPGAGGMLLRLMSTGDQQRMSSVQLAEADALPPVVGLAEKILSKEGVKKMLVRKETSKGRLKKKILTLSDWGMDEMAVEKVVRSKANILSLSCATVQKKLDYLKENYDFDREEVMKVIRRFPTFLALSLEGNVQPHLNGFLKDYPKADVKKMILRFPNIIGYAKKLGQMKIFLRASAGVSESDLTGVVMRFPALLGYSIEDNLKAKLDKFRLLGFTTAELGKLITDCPSLLGRNFEKTITAKMEWLRDSFEFHDRDAVDNFKKVPGTFVVALSTWESAHLFLKTMGATHEEIKQLLHRNFKILSQKDVLLKEKVDFAQSVLHKRNQDILSCPEYLTESLRLVLLPRIGMLHHIGEDPRKLPLSFLFGEAFAEKVEYYNEQELQSFKEQYHSVPMHERIKFMQERLG